MLKLLKFVVILFCVIFLLLITWFLSWRFYGDILISNHYLNLFKKYGGTNLLNEEAINIYDRIKLGFNFKDIDEFSDTLFPNLLKIGFVDYDYRIKDLPRHIYIIQGPHSHKYRLELYDPRISDIKIKSRGIKITENIRLVGWSWKDQFRFF